MTYSEYFKQILESRNIDKITMISIKESAYYFSNEKDFKDIEKVVELLKQKNINEATIIFSGLETIVRDAICDILEK